MLSHLLKLGFKEFGVLKNGTKVLRKISMEFGNTTKTWNKVERKAASAGRPCKVTTDYYLLGQDGSVTPMRRAAGNHYTGHSASIWMSGQDGAYLRTRYSAYRGVGYKFN